MAAAHGHGGTSQNVQAQQAAEKSVVDARREAVNLRAQVEAESRERVRVETEEALRQERLRGEMAADEAKKVLEARIKALQTMVDTLSSSEGSAEDALKRQLSALTERNGHLEAALLQARGDFKKLTEEAAVVSAKAETHLAALHQMQAAQRRAEQAEDLHDLLLLRRSLLRLSTQTKESRRLARIDAAATTLGDRMTQRTMFRALRKGVQLTVCGRLLRERVVARRVAVASSRAAALVAHSRSTAVPPLTQGQAAGLRAAGGELAELLVHREAAEAAALDALCAQAMRCNTYMSLLQAAARPVHLLGAAFSQLRLALAHARLRRLRALALAERSEALVVARCFEVLTTQSQRAKAAAAHALRRVFVAWRRSVLVTRVRAARMREGVLFQSYLLQCRGEGTRGFMRREGGAAMRVGTSAGAGALLWMLAARHEWLIVTRASFAGLYANWAEAREASLGLHVGDRELLLRVVFGWAAAAQLARREKMKAEEAQRMRARRTLALARGALLLWRHERSAAGTLRLRLEGLRLRREIGALRRLWHGWCVSKGERLRSSHAASEEEVDGLRSMLAEAQERAQGLDVEVMHLTDKLQLLSADKAQVDVQLSEHQRKVETISVALEEADIRRTDLELQLERQRLTGHDGRAVKESALQTELVHARETLALRESQLQVCQGTLRDTLEKLHATTAQLHARDEVCLLSPSLSLSRVRA